MIQVIKRCSRTVIALIDIKQNHYEKSIISGDCVIHYQLFKKRHSAKQFDDQRFFGFR